MSPGIANFSLRDERIKKKFWRVHNLTGMLTDLEGSIALGIANLSPRNQWIKK